MSKEAYLDEASNNLKLMVHQTATYLHSLSATAYGSDEPPESGISSMLWWSVDSSSNAGLSSAAFQSICRDHMSSYHSHRDLYSVTVCMVLGFAPAGQLVQMPAAAHSVPKISELLLHDLQLQDLGLSRPLWVWLWIQRYFVNPGIWAAFLCVHPFPFHHTSGIYSHHPQKTSLATTSNDILPHEEEQIALPFVEEVHWAGHFHSSLLEGVSLLMCRLGQVQDTLQVSWEAMARMSLSASRRSEIPPKYPAATHCAIVQKYHCDARCLPTLMRNMLAAIHKPSILQKHPTKCTSPPGSSRVLALPQSIRAQWRVHSPLVFRRVVFHWLISIQTTALSCTALQSESSIAPHPVELLCLQSG